MAEPGTPNKKSVKTATPTSYLVLRRFESQASEHAWSLVKPVSASSAKSAIREVVSKLPQGEQAGTYTAVPTRSFQPVLVAAKTTVQLELTEVKS